jgi:hypothetical protein
MYKIKKKIWIIFTSKFVGTGPPSCEKRIYRAAVSQSLVNTDLWNVIFKEYETRIKWHFPADTP